MRRPRTYDGAYGREMRVQNCVYSLYWRVKCVEKCVSASTGVSSVLRGVCSQYRLVKCVERLLRDVYSRVKYVERYRKGILSNTANQSPDAHYALHRISITARLINHCTTYQSLHRLSFTAPHINHCTSY